MKVLMVCLGNICRSPLAQGILEHKKPEWIIDSAGTAAYHIGNPPDRRSINEGRKHGIDISAQQARQIEKADLKKFDLILTMDAENYNNVLRMASDDEERKKVHMIMNFLYPGQNRVVPDPYYNDRFPEVYQLLDLATDSIILNYS